MGGYAKQRAPERIARLAGQGLDLVSFWHAATEVLVPAIPFHLTPCFYTLDPASLLVTSHYHDGLPTIPHDWLAHEYYGEDFNQLADVARSASGVATLHAATGGDPRRSARYRMAMEPFGADEEALVALRTRSGAVWGMLALYRLRGQPRFDEDELALLHELALPLAEGARRGLLVGEASDPDRPDAPGLVVLREDWGVESMTPGVERWLEELPDGDWRAERRLPPSVLAVAGRALRAAEHADAPGEVAFARVLARDGRWMVLHGAALIAGGTRRVAVIVEPAHPARIVPLLMAAYGLTERERDITQLVLQGNATAEIAERLEVTPQTVQQHLKSIFDKAGVRSRRELVGKVFFAHYEPRVRDNEGRALMNRPLRGGPLEQSGSPR
jgi:DNA-binding CsgD family transcriptional regulator